MLLAIDVGNTHSLFALCDGDRITHSWRVSTDAHRTEDEYAAMLLGLMQQDGLKADSIAASILSSVVPDTVFPIRRCCEHYFNAAPLVVNSDTVDLGMDVLLDNPAELGADRLVNAYAAWNKWHQPLIIIDFGTATTFDVVNGKGQYVGGVIAPGVNLSLEALSKAAAKLHRIRIRQPETVIGKNTTHAMQAGIYYGYLGLVNTIIAQIQAEHSETFKVVATGGLAELFSRDNDAIHDVDQELTIRGLMRIHGRHQ